MHSTSPITALLVLAYGLTLASGARLPFRQVVNATTTPTTPALQPFAPTPIANATGAFLSVSTPAVVPSGTTPANIPFAPIPFAPSAPANSTAGVSTPVVPAVVPSASASGTTAAPPQPFAPIPFAPTAAANGTAAVTTPLVPAGTTSTLPVFDSMIGSASLSAGSSAATAGSPLNATSPASYYTCGTVDYLYCCPTSTVTRNPVVPEEFSGTGCTYEGYIAVPTTDFGACSGAGLTALCCSYDVTSNTTTVDLPSICIQAIPHAPPATAITTTVPSTATPV